MTISTLEPMEALGYSVKRWTAEECRRLVEHGSLDPERYELIEGSICRKMPQGRLHVYVVTQIIALLSAIFGVQRLQSQAQIGIGEFDPYNDPEPDVALLRQEVGQYLHNEPIPQEDVLLVVEVASSSLRGDTSLKEKIYARNGIPEYWVVAIPTRKLMVYRQPTPDGYTEIRILSAGETISALNAPDNLIAVSDLLPPSEDSAE